jgi:hypothetical protein
MEATDDADTNGRMSSDPRPCLRTVILLTAVRRQLPETPRMEVLGDTDLAANRAWAAEPNGARCHVLADLLSADLP